MSLVSDFEFISNSSNSSFEMARTKTTPAHLDSVPDSRCAPSANVPSGIVDTRSPTPPSSSVPPSSESPTVAAVMWVDNNGVHYPFSAKVAGNEEGSSVVSAIQLRSVGIITSSFLNASALSHTVKFKVSDEDVGAIKAFVKSGPIASEKPGFYWPFHDGVAVANNKEDLSSPFREAYDGRSKALDDLDEDDLIPVHRIRPGVKVCVEYTPTVWSGRKSGDGGTAKFGGGGCSLKLQAVVLLEDGFNFGSPRKRRKLAQ
jgi:hypothetical protein